MQIHLPSADNPALARDRILHVAAELFVAHGLKATSVRKICERANVNVAMVNYYFHSKDELYLAVLEFARQHRETGEDVADDTLPAREQLRLAIRRLTFNLLSPGPASLFTQLLARELTEPSAAIAQIAEHDIKPQHAFFARLVRAAVGEAMSDAEVQNCVFSIIGQAVFYARARPVHELAAPEIRYDELGMEKIADHIYRFSLAGLDALHSAGAGR